jgi:hypothetical protein
LLRSLDGHAARQGLVMLLGPLLTLAVPLNNRPQPMTVPVAATLLGTKAMERAIRNEGLPAFVALFGHVGPLILGILSQPRDEFKRNYK